MPTKKTLMAMCFLDTNLCVGYLDPNSPYHESSSLTIQNLITSKYIPAISPLVLDELIHSLMRNLRVVGQLNPRQSLPITKMGIKSLLELPQITLINPPVDLQNQMKIFILMEKYHLKPRDAYHLLTINHHKIKYFATLDHDFDAVFAHTSLKPFPPSLKTVSN